MRDNTEISRCSKTVRNVGGAGKTAFCQTILTEFLSAEVPGLWKCYFRKEHCSCRTPWPIGRENESGIPLAVFWLLNLAHISFLFPLLYIRSVW